MIDFQSHARTFVSDIQKSFLDLTIIIGVIAFFQFVVIREIPDGLFSMVSGLVIVGIGLAFFMRGLEIGVFPLGENLAKQLSSSKSRFWIILFAFVVGFATTIAEPALLAIAHKAALISGGQIDALALRLVVALSVGVAIVIGVVRIMVNHPIHYYIIAGYAFVLAVTYFAPPEIVGLAYDSGGVTTSTVTVPLIAALGIGLATSLKNRNPIIDGFGLIAFASLTPMIFVQLYGIAAYTFGGAAVELPHFLNALATSSSLVGSSVSLASTNVVIEYALRLITTIGDVLPILLTILFFYFAVLRKPIENPTARFFGFSLVVLGLYAFVIGLELGLFPIGESIAQALAEKGNTFLVYLFAFTIGFATTIAEPALTAIARKAEEISGGAVHAFALRIFVASGVGVGILLGAYRIVHGDPIVWYIMAGYAVVVILTFFAPRTIIPIAYDSGGVTTSTVTVPIVAALGLGLASSIPGRDPLIDGFGLIAFASLFPMIAVLSYGIFEQEKIKRFERKLSSLGTTTVDRILRHLQEEDDNDVIQKTKKEIITITGTAGSGVSSVAQHIASKLRYQYFSSGAIFRATAEKHGISLSELMVLAEKDHSIDREIDELIQELGIKQTRLIIDSPLAYHWIHRSFKVFLSVSPEVGATRRFAQSASSENTSLSMTYDDVLGSIEERKQSKIKRYQELYGLDIQNTRPFNLVLDTENLSVEETAKKILTEYHAWLKKK